MAEGGTIFYQFYWIDLCLECLILDLCSLLEFLKADFADTFKITCECLVNQRVQKNWFSHTL